MLQQNAELIAAEPRQSIPRAQLGTQQCRHLSQEIIPGSVPTGIVDDLELIEVEVQQCVRHIWTGRRQQMRQAALELTPIDKPRQRIVRRLMRQLLRELALFRDIAEHEDDTDALLSAIADRSRRHMDAELALISADQQMAHSR